MIQFCTLKCMADAEGYCNVVFDNQGMEEGDIRGIKRVEDRRRVRVVCSGTLLRKNCLLTSRCRKRTRRFVIFLKAFLKNCVLEDVSRLFWSLSKHFWLDQANRFLHIAEFCTLTIIISGNVFNDVMNVKNLKQSAKSNPPDDIDLASKLDLDNQPTMIFFLRNINDKYRTETKFFPLLHAF